MNPVNNYPGLYVIFEGLGGSGKGTQIDLLAKKLEEFGIKYTSTKEPGGTPEGVEIRKRLLNDKSLTPEEEVSLFLNDRKLNIARNVIPALKEGKVVIQDRSWISNMAYQGQGKGLTVRHVFECNRPLIFDIIPDIVVYLDVNWEIGKRRKSLARDENDKFDQADAPFWQAVQEGYSLSLERIKKYLPGVQVLILDDKVGKRGKDSIFQELWERLDLVNLIREKEGQTKNKEVEVSIPGRER